MLDTSSSLLTQYHSIPIFSLWIWSYFTAAHLCWGDFGGFLDPRTTQLGWTQSDIANSPKNSGAKERNNLGHGSPSRPSKFPPYLSMVNYKKPMGQTSAIFSWHFRVKGHIRNFSILWWTRAQQKHPKKNQRKGIEKERDLEPTTTGNILDLLDLWVSRGDNLLEPVNISGPFVGRFPKPTSIHFQFFKSWLRWQLRPSLKLTYPLKTWRREREATCKEKGHT